MTDVSRTILDRWNDRPPTLSHHIITSSGIHKSPRSEVTPDVYLEDHVRNLVAGPTQMPSFESFWSSALEHPAALGWVADYERCVAWTWLSMTMGEGSR